MIFLFISLNNNFLDREKLLVTTVYSYSLVFVILYFIHLLTFCIQVIILRLIRSNIYFFSCYPFSYDGSIRFKPIKMLYHQELYETQIPYNFFSLINGNDDRKLGFSKFKRNIILWVFSKCASVMVTWFIFKYLLEINLGLELAVLLISNIITQYMFYNEIHYGYFFSYHNKDFEIYSIVNVAFKFISFETLTRVIMEINKMNTNELVYRLLNSYLYKCVEQTAAPIKLENFKKHVEFNDNLRDLSKSNNPIQKSI